MERYIDLTGKRFGRLTVIERDFETQKIKHGKRLYWKCRCDCGNRCTLYGPSLTRGVAVSCGCLKRETLSKIRKRNLVEKTKLDNIASNKPSKNNHSGVLGVSYLKSRGVWAAQLIFQGNRVLNKRFKCKQDAINARKEAEEKYFKPILEKYDYEKSC